MFMKILKFLGLLVLLHLISIFIPFGSLVVTGIVLYALWNIVS